MGSISDFPVLRDIPAEASTAKARSSREDAAPVCPNCAKPTLYRVARKGLLQRLVLPRFGYFPWQCKICKADHLIKNRGVRRRHRSKSSERPS